MNKKLDRLRMIINIIYRWSYPISFVLVVLLFLPAIIGIETVKDTLETNVYDFFHALFFFTAPFILLVPIVVFLKILLMQTNSNIKR